MTFTDFCIRYETSAEEARLLAAHLCTIRTNKFMKEVETLWSKPKK